MQGLSPASADLQPFARTSVNSSMQAGAYRALPARASKSTNSVECQGRKHEARTGGKGACVKVRRSGVPAPTADCRRRPPPPGALLERPRTAARAPSASIKAPPPLVQRYRRTKLGIRLEKKRSPLPLGAAARPAGRAWPSSAAAAASLRRRSAEQDHMAAGRGRGYTPACQIQEHAGGGKAGACSGDVPRPPW